MVRSEAVLISRIAERFPSTTMYPSTMPPKIGSLWKWSYPQSSFSTGSSTPILSPAGMPSWGLTRASQPLATYSRITGSRMFPASMYLFGLSPGYRPAISQATLNGVAKSLIPRIGATLVPVIFLSL